MRITVRDLMVTASMVSHETTIAAARSLLLRQRSDEVYIVDDDGVLQGVVSDDQFLLAELNGIDGATPVSSLVQSVVDSAEIDTDISKVLAKLREEWRGRIAVVENGRLVGRLIRADVLRLVLHLRDAVGITEVTAEPVLNGPHFHHRERLARVRRTSKTAGRRLRRLAVS